jgi:hypothetical protein
MDDLFRFVLLRPANLPSPNDLKVLEPKFLDEGGGGEDDDGEGSLDSESPTRGKRHKTTSPRSRRSTESRTWLIAM